jgi:hypothetical protein
MFAKTGQALAAEAMRLPGDLPLFIVKDGQPHYVEIGFSIQKAGIQVSLREGSVIEADDLKTQIAKKHGKL